MRILVVSDTHGSIQSVIEYIEREERFDMFVHLGDYTEDGKTISAMTGIESIVIKGNCDYLDEKSPEEYTFELYGKKIFMTHGHNYGVKRDMGSLFYRAKELDIDIVLFGHTHIAMSIEHEGIALFNPGSSSEPRLGEKPSIGVLEIAEGVFKKNIIKL